MYDFRVSVSAPKEINTTELMVGGMFEGGVLGEKSNSANYWCGSGKEAHPPTAPFWGQIPVE